MLAQLECPRGQTQALHRQRLVLVLLALVLYRHRLVLVLLAAPPTADAARQHVQVSLSRVVHAGVASWVLYRQRLVLAHLLQCCYHRQRLAHLQRLVHFRCCQRLAVPNKKEELETLHCQY